VAGGGGCTGLWGVGGVGGVPINRVQGKGNPAHNVEGPQTSLLIN